MKISAPIAGTLAALLLAQPAQAGNWNNTWVTSIAIAGGEQSFDVDPLEFESDSGGEARIRAGKMIGRDWAALAELSYAAFDYDFGFRRGEISRVAGFAVAQYHLPTGGRVRPYAALGAGVVHFDSAKDHDVSFGLKGGAGIDFAITERTSIFVEGQYTHFFDVLEEDFAETTGALGLSFRFQ